ncbi:DUF1801 domain-containing protein [Afipia broomeae]|uniref:YdhG-like domain-containing protein n=1 Tax=Afipia broomeae ATCC 49717 TaxID=883078 RepID=K8P932_9BRAD|nr:DUF1801 domain-containing protein [Afipia broomeae]EKS37294.1 hypothetical protein HMPREF9695_03712 [Afipia broomeae ATCC 49717]
MKRNTGRSGTFNDSNVAKVFAAYPEDVRAKLMKLRAIIFETAETIDGVGPLEETLKWGQPSYLTTETGSGSTIRIDREKSDGRVAMYFHCQTDLVETFREFYPTQMEYGGNRSILFKVATRIPENALRHCVGLALTYHARKVSSKNKTPSKNKAASKKKAIGVKKAVSKKQREPGKPEQPALRTRARPS